MFYKTKENDLVCTFDGEFVDFGRGPEKVEVKKNGITTISVPGWTHHFYPSEDYPLITFKKEFQVHLYPIEEDKVIKIDEKFCLKSDLDLKKLLKDSYKIIQRSITEDPMDKNGNINHESIYFNANDAYDLLTRIDYAIKGEDINQYKQKVIDWKNDPETYK